MKKNRDLNDWLAVVKKTVDAKAKTAWQTLLLVRETNTHYLGGYGLLKYKESKDQKNSKAKKNHFFTTNNNKGNGGQSR